MLRVLFFLAVVFALGLGFSWLAERPGELTVVFGGYQYRVSLMVAAILITAVVAALMISWWLIKSIWNSPHAVARYFRVRRRDRGYQALSTGMIAAGAGDSELARRKKREAMKLLSADQEPLIHLLDAQASLLEGDHEAARRKFEAMLDDPEMRLLGLRGLYLEAQRMGEQPVARHYAERAAKLAPQLSWAADASLERMAQAGEWDSALQLVDAQKATRQIEREQLRRRKAVILTAKAIELLDADPTAAKNAALEAEKLAPDLVPASVTAAKALFRLNDLRRGSKLLENAWKRQAHPEIADTYVHARPGDSTHDRLSRARRLSALRQYNAEGSLVVARAAFEAGEFAEARKALDAVLRQEPREGAFLLLADIEEAETGDQGRIRQWLARAVRAPRDPAWVADGHVADAWAPVSPMTGRLDAFEWRPPVERLGQVVEVGEADLALAMLPPARSLEDEAAVEVEAEPAQVQQPAAEKAAQAEPPAAPEAPPAAAAPVAPPGPAAAAVPAEAPEPPRVEIVPPPPEPEAAEEDTRRIARIRRAKPADPRVPPPPDDPGVDPEETRGNGSAPYRLF